MGVLQFLRELLAALPGVTDLQTEPGGSGGADTGADIVARFEGRPMLVEAKALTPQTSRRLAPMIDQIQSAWTEYQQRHGAVQKPRLIIAFPGVLLEQRQTASRLAGVEIWDGVMLRRLARGVGLYPPEFLAVPEEEEAPARREPAVELADRLRTIPLGLVGRRSSS